MRFFWLVLGLCSGAVQETSAGAKLASAGQTETHQGPHGPTDYFQLYANEDNRSCSRSTSAPPLGQWTLPGGTAGDTAEADPSLRHHGAGLEVPHVSAVSAGQFPVLPGLRTALAKSSRIRRGRAKCFALAITQLSTVAAFNIAETTSRTRAVAFAEELSWELPSAPTVGAVMMPKETPQASTSSVPSGEAVALQALIGALSKSREDLPPAVRELLDTHAGGDPTTESKTLHRLVSSQTAAKKELRKVQTLRKEYLASWSDFLGKLAKTWAGHLEEKDRILQSYDVAEQGWEQKLSEASAALSKLTASGRPSDTISVGSEDMDDAEEMVNAEIQRAEEQQKMREEMAAKEAAITKGLEAANQAAAASAATAMQSERERSPRRRQTAQGDKQEEPKKEPPGKAPHAESDYVAPFMARVLGLRRAYEVDLDRLGIHTTFEFDERIYQYEIDGGHARPFEVTVATTGCDPLIGAVRCAGEKGVYPSTFLDAGGHMDNGPCCLDEVGGAPDLACTCSSSHHLRPALKKSDACAIAAVHSVHLAEPETVQCRPCKHVSFARVAQFFEPPAKVQASRMQLSLHRHVPPVACTVRCNGRYLSFHLPVPPKPVTLPTPPAGASDARHTATDTTFPLDRMAAQTEGAFDDPEVDVSHGSAGQLVAIGPLARTASRSLYTVFEHRMDHLSRGALTTWGPDDYARDAARAIPYPLRAVHFLNVPMGGLPTPQLVLTDNTVPALHRAMPVDLRPANGLVHTITVPPSGSAEMLWELLAAKGVDPESAYRTLWQTGGCSFRNEAGERFDSWDVTTAAQLPEWLCLSAGGGGSLPEIAYVGGPERTLRVPPRVPFSPATEGRDVEAHPYRRPVPGSEATHPRPFWPTEVARILAQHVEVTPQHLAGPLQRIPLDRLVDLDLPAFDAASQRGRFTVFEAGERPRSRPSFQAWVLEDYIADAVSAARRPPRAAQVLTKPIHGFPLPQIVLTPRDADREDVALVCDWRSKGSGVVTILCPPAIALADFEGLITRDAPRPHLPAIAEGALAALQDAFDRQFQALLQPANQHEWIVPVIAAGPDEASTTTTVTAKLPTAEASDHFAASSSGATQEVDMLQEVVPAWEPSDDSLPEGVCQPADLCQGHGINRPLAELCLFPCLGSPFAAASIGRPHQFTVLTHDWPVTLLPAVTTWTAVSFFQAAFAWLGHMPRRAQLLTQSIPGLPEPQIVLTDQDVPASALVIPLDLRGVGGGITPAVLEPGQTVVEVVHTLHTPDMPPLDAPIYHELFVQDTRGGVFSQVPDALSDVQWLRVCCSNGMCTMPGGLLTSTTTTSTGMQMPEVRVRFVMSGGATTMQLPAVPVAMADPVEAVAELLFAMASAGRLQEGSTVTLGAAWPPSDRGVRIVPFVVSEPGEHVRQMVLFDPSYDGSQLYAMGVQPGLYAEDLMSNNYRQCGLTLRINGVHMSAVVRPLRTGDYIQLLPDRPTQVPTIVHPEDLLDSVNRLRAFSAPLRVPAFPINAARASHEGTRQHARNALLRAMDLATRTRVELMGLPARVSQAVTVLEPGRAPHHLHLPLRLTPTLAEAEDSIRDTGIVPRDYRMVDTLLDSRASSVFLAMPPNMPGLVLTLCDPSIYGAFHLLHLPRGVRPPLQRLPVRQGFVLALPANIEDGAHVATARPIVYAPVSRRPAVVRAAPDSSASTGTSMDTAASGRVPSGMSEVASLAGVGTLDRPESRRDGEEAGSEPQAASSAGPAGSRPLSDGTSLAQILPSKSRRRQIIFDDSPESARAGVIAALSSNADQCKRQGGPHSISVPTPFGRRSVKSVATPQPSRTIYLSELLPRTAPEEHQIRFAVNREVGEHVFEPFAVTNLQKEVRAELHPAAAALLASLSPLPTNIAGHQAMLFVDGSFDTASKKGTWAVAVVVEDQQVWYWGGFASGHFTGLRGDSASAYQAELYAQLVAHLIVAASQWRRSCIFYDATAAAQVTACEAAAKEWEPLQQSAAAARLGLMVSQREPTLVHVKSHTGHPGNELADSIATGAHSCGPQPAHLQAHLQQLVSEKVLNWIWLPQASAYSPAWPTLADTGATVPSMLAATSQPVRCPADWAFPATAAHKPARRIQIRFCTYNTLSSRSCLQKRSLHSFLKFQSIDVFALQETRETVEPVRVIDGVHRFASQAVQGQLGCQIWVDVTKQKDAWDLQAFAIVHSNPRLLIVRAKLRQQPVLLISGHARTTAASEQEVQEWWDMLDDAMRRAPRGCVPLIGVDANAHWSASTPTNANACHMEAVMNKLNLASSGTHLADGQPITTWTSPQGVPFCLDYVLLPKEWRAATTVHGAIPILDEHSGIDHDPLLVELEVHLESNVQGSRKRLDVERMHTSEGKRDIEYIFRTAPCPPWSVDVDTHLQCLNQHFQKQLLRHFPAPARQPRSPVTSPDTWALLLRKRMLRRAHHARARAWAQECLRFCFQTWAHTGEAAGTREGSFVRRLARDVIATTVYGGKMRLLVRSIRRSAKSDEARFTRHVFQEAANAGPARKAHLIRAVLKTGRRYRPARAAIILKDDQGDIVDQDEVLQRLGEHFAKAEQASPEPLATLQGETRPTAPAQLEVGSLPTLADLARGFASLKSRKAPGISGLCADFYKAAPALAAVHHLPLVLKMASRETAPLLWSGSLSVPLAKPAKDRFDVTGYRAIALLEASAKAVGKAMRPQLLAGLERIVHPGTAGARQGLPLELPSLTGQVFLDYLKSTQTSGALLYVDGISAFYATNRAILGQGDDEQRRQWIAQLPIEVAIKEIYLDLVSGESCLQHAQVEAMTQRLVQAGFTATWFATRPQHEVIFRTRAGTIPGAPLADILFQIVAAPAFDCLQQCLDREDLSVSIQGCSAHLMTWLDDFAVPITADNPADLPARLSRTAALTSQALAITGIAMNFGVGKSEAIVQFHGHGREKARAQLFVQQRGKLPVSLPAGKNEQLACVDRYIHLGSCRNPECQALPDIQRRKIEAATVCKHVRQRLLRNPSLTLDERRHYLLSLVISRFMHGMATWPLHTKKERSAYRAAYMGLLRPAVRPLLSVPCWKMTQEQVCTVLKALTADEAISIARARLVAQIAAKGTDFLKALLHASGHWRTAAFWDVGWLVSLQLDSRLTAWWRHADVDSFVSSWPLTVEDTRLLLRKARRSCIDARSPEIKACLRQAQALAVAEQRGLLHFSLPDKAGAYPCRECPASFSTAAARASHYQKVHSMPAPQRAAIGTACLCCRKQYWSTKRLREHLRHVATCRQVYSAADLSAQDDEVIGASQCPVVPFVGPIPWWATLRPPEEEHRAPVTPPVAQVSSRIPPAVRQISDLPAFMKHMARADGTEVESFLADYGGARSEENTFLRFAVDWTRAYHTEGLRGDFEAEGLMLVQTRGALLLAETAVMQELLRACPES
ncbi:unnamed protein product [Symbiodinium sp. KB8]|nr:unnamed protein product [Symbiodinium sp. KB8]